MNNTNETDGKNELITYHVYLRDSGKEIANLSVQINPKDTLKSFVDKLMQTWFVQYLDKSDVKSDGKFCAVRLLYNTTIINPLDTEMTVGGYFSNQSDISINSVISLETNRSSSGSGGRIFLEDVMNSDAVKSAEAGTEDLGKLPLYKVVSKEDAANPGKKCNRFEKTGEFIGLSMKGKEFGYKGFDVSIDKECVLKATNPLHRFIISDHLRTQQKTGRLTGAKNISKRKIGGFDNMPTKVAEKNNRKVTEVSIQNGWQGINVADYTKVYYNSNTGVSGNDYKDALDYYAKMSDILLQGTYMLLCALGSLISSFIVGYFAAKVAASFSQKIRSEVFNKVEDFSMTEIKKFSTSSLITRTTNDITQVQMLLALGLQVFIKAPIMAIWAIIKISGKSFEWTLLTGGAVLVLLIVVMVIVIFAVPKFKKIQNMIDDINNITRENLTGIRVVRAFNAESYQENKFEQANLKLTKTQLFVQRIMSVMGPTMQLILSGLSLGIYFVGAFIIDAANMIDRINIFSDMVVFSSYAVQVIIAFMMLIIIFIIYPRKQLKMVL